MDYVLTLVANPAQPVATKAVVAAVTEVMKALGADVGAPQWLAPGIACDISFDHLTTDQAMDTARQCLNGAPVDALAQSAGGRRKRLLLADMESTIIADEVLDELAERAGLANTIKAITHRAMNGELDFAQALHERVGLLAGQPVSLIQDITNGLTINPGAATLIKTMRAAGAPCILVTGGLMSVAKHVAAQLGFDGVEANDFEVQDGQLTGRILEPVRGAQAKLKTLLQRAAAAHLPLQAAAAIGDGANDIPMLQAAGLGIAYHPKPTVAANTPLHLHYADLTGLLYAQGYREEELVS